MSERRLAIVIDPTKAEAGGRVVKRTLEEMAEKARQAEGVTNRLGPASNDNFTRMAKSAGVASHAMGLLNAAVLGVAAALSVGALKNYADAWSDMQSRVGAAIKDMDAAPAMMQRMVDLANASYSPLAQTVEVYSRNVGVLGDLGIAAAGAADFTEALNHALVITATRGERAASVQDALSKAMAVGKLQADGLETVLANGGRVAEALADELNTTVSGLRAMASQGTITGDVIANALLGSLQGLREEAGKMPATIGDAFTRLNTNVTAFIGTLDQAWGVSGRAAEQMLVFANAILSASDIMVRLGNIVGSVLGPAFDVLAGNIDTVGQIAAIVGASLLGFFAGPALITGIGAVSVALTTGLVPALGAVAGGMRAVSLAMMANPLGLLVAGLAAAVTAAFIFRDEIKQAIGIDFIGIVHDAINNVIGLFVGGFKAIVGAWGLIPGAFADIFTRAMNQSITIVENGINAIVAALRNVPGLGDLAGVDLSGWLREESGALTTALDVVQTEFRAAFSTDYIGEAVTALGDLWSTAAGASGAITNLGNDLAGGSGAPSSSGGLAGSAGKASTEIAKLEDSATEAAQTIGDAFQNTLGSILTDLFSKPIEGLDDLVDRALSGLGQLGQANLSASMDILFGGGDGIAKAVEEGAEAGAETGIVTGQADFWSTLMGGGDGKGSPLMNVLGAGASGLGIGYQTQDPVMGALGGALSGIGGGPLGILAGGIGGLIGGFLGAAKAAQEAKDKIAAMSGEIYNLVDVGEGRGLGEMTKAFRDYWDKNHEFQALAAKAQDVALQKRLQAAVNSFFLFLETDFKLGFEGTIAALEGGQGFSGAFVSAQQQIVGLREALKGFVADTQYMGEKLGELAGIDTAAQTAADVARAQASAQDYVLTLLAGAEALTEVEKAVAEANGKASALPVTLEQLGLAAEAAAGAIAEALGFALARLRDDFTQDLNASINDLSGFGFLNEIAEAQTIYQERLRDAAALGLDGALALEELRLSISGIVRDSGLSKSGLERLAAAMPHLASMFALAEDATLSLADTRARVARAEADLRAAYDEQARVLGQSVTRLGSFITSLQKFRDELRLDANLSPLNPRERLLEAEDQFRTVMATAMSGGEGAEAALGRVEEVGRNYLEEARAYYGTSTQYFTIFEEVEHLLDGLLGSAKTQMTDAERQLAALNQQIGALIDINTSVLSVTDAIANLTAAQSASDAALAAQLAQLAHQNDNGIGQVYQSALGRAPDPSGLAYWNDQMNQGQTLGQISAQIGNSREAQIQGLYQKIFNRAADPSGLDFWYNSGKSIAQMTADMEHLRSIGRYADGGMHLGGVRIVGERGPELEATGAARIWTAQQTRAFLQPANGNSSAELVREFQEMRRELAELRDEMGRNTQATVAGARGQIEATEQTAEAVRQQTDAQRRASGARAA